DDAAALVARVRDLLHSAREVALHAERSEVALASETDVVVEGLRQQVQQLTLAQQAIQEEQQARETSLSSALRTASGRVEELLQELAEAREAAAAASRAAEEEVQAVEERWREEARK
ncbi:uncharacterized protein HaLaN_19009, partial [Haematococcus lacustris]